MSSRRQRSFLLGGRYRQVSLHHSFREVVLIWIRYMDGVNYVMMRSFRFWIISKTIWLETSKTIPPQCITTKLSHCFLISFVQPLSKSYEMSSKLIIATFGIVWSTWSLLRRGVWEMCSNLASNNISTCMICGRHLKKSPSNYLPNIGMQIMPSFHMRRTIYFIIKWGPNKWTVDFTLK